MTGQTLEDKLRAVALRYEDVQQQLADPAVYADARRLRALSREEKELSAVAEGWQALRARRADLAAALELAEEPSFREGAREEIDAARADIENLTERLKLLLLPRDKDDGKNVVLELRAGAGGEEAALFARVLLRMYSMYAARRGWRAEVVNCSETELGGVKEAEVLIEGEDVFSRLKFESGVHRVQRVPVTETQGRIQTSTVTVAVLPEAEEAEVEIEGKDLQIDTFRSSGAGGQHVNKTESAIRITHLPTGLVVECQDERSQYKNKDRAMKILAARLLEQERARQHDAVAAQRRAQVGTGERSERIRTYNYPQGRVTDHRIGLTLYQLDAVLDGALDALIDPLLMAHRAEQMRAGEENTGV